MSELLERNEAYDSRFWQEGVCGNCNVVSFDGEDIHGVLFVADDLLRQRIISEHNLVVRRMLRSNKV